MYHKAQSLELRSPTSRFRKISYINIYQLSIRHLKIFAAIDPYCCWLLSHFLSVIPAEVVSKTRPQHWGHGVCRCWRLATSAESVAWWHVTCFIHETLGFTGVFSESLFAFYFFETNKSRDVVGVGWGWPMSHLQVTQLFGISYPTYTWEWCSKCPNQEIYQPLV